MIEHPPAEKDPGKWKRVVMIQCVGSRNEQNPDCSRICRQSAVKHALQLKEINPEMEIYILYRDMRTYGMLEDYCMEARRKGVLFARFDSDKEPEVRTNGAGVEVVFSDHVLQRWVKIAADAVVLSAATCANNTDGIASQLKVPRKPTGFSSKPTPSFARWTLPPRAFSFAARPILPSSWARASLRPSPPLPGQGLFLPVKRLALEGRWPMWTTKGARPASCA